VPLLRGRGFSTDDAAETPFVAVINETMAQRLWPGEDPIGRQVWLEAHDYTWEVVGIVADVPPLDPDAPQDMEMYFAQAQYTRPFTYFTLRTEGDPGALREAVVDRVQGVDPDLQPSRIRTYSALMDQQLVQPRFNMLLIGIFSLVAVFLAAVGIFGVVSRSVAARTREIGIRIALGAQQMKVLREVVTQSMILTGGGLLLGLGLALVLSRFVRSLLHGVVPTDPLTYATVAVGLFVVAALASFIPAMAASRVDPMESLREEA
jgi:putative ABC transport system permease protein